MHFQFSFSKDIYSLLICIYFASPFLCSPHQLLSLSLTHYFALSFYLSSLSSIKVNCMHSAWLQFNRQTNGIIAYPNENIYENHDINCQSGLSCISLHLLKLSLSSYFFLFRFTDNYENGM